RRLVCVSGALSFPTRRSSDLQAQGVVAVVGDVLEAQHDLLAHVSAQVNVFVEPAIGVHARLLRALAGVGVAVAGAVGVGGGRVLDRKSTRLNSSHRTISYAVC